MAIVFARISIHKRSQGHSAVAASAYRSGTKLFDERTGKTHNYKNRKDVAYSGIILPESSNLKFQDREHLWNQTEHAEKRKDAQIAKELTLALPKELSLSQQIQLARQFTKIHFTKHGLATEIAIHDNNSGNPHAHILISMRRLEKNGFSKKKARDLNPEFYGKTKKTVFDPWHTKWRGFQNEYFQANHLKLSVDEQYVIATKHEGKIRNTNTEHYLAQENIKKKSFMQRFITSEHIFNHLTKHHQTFTEQDIKRVIQQNTDRLKKIKKLTLKIKNSKNLVILNENSQGKPIYTTRVLIDMETKMLKQALSLNSKRSKSLSAIKLEKLKRKYSLQAEQAEAVNYLLTQGDIACLVGRAGTGKTYTLKAIKSIYEKYGYKLYGSSLAGIATKGLQEKTGIKADTIYSLVKRVESKRFCPKPKSILIIDEAGMVGLKDMASILNYAKLAKCKVLLVGDPEQLQPIAAGTPFRSILEQIGFAELQNIQRQQDPLDRQASRHLSQGKTELAMHHYKQKGQLFSNNSEQAKQQLINQWKKGIAESYDTQIILAHSKQQVRELNFLARQVMLENHLLGTTAKRIKTETGYITVSEGDRIVLLKNDYDLNIFNGEFATIEKIHGQYLTLKLKSKNLTLNSRDYNHFDYGYAITVHKSQGSTFDKVFVYMSGQHWDRHLTYVSMTRHTISLQVYTSNTSKIKLNASAPYLLHQCIRQHESIIRSPHNLSP